MSSAKLKTVAVVINEHIRQLYNSLYWQLLILSQFW